MKKIVISIVIFLLTFLIIFLSINSKEKKNEKKQNYNISIILETEEGNIQTNNFPSKEDYEYSKVFKTRSKNNFWRWNVRKSIFFITMKNIKFS